MRCREQLQPRVLPGPVFRQVDGDAAGVAGDPSGQVYQVPTDGGGACGGVAASGEGGGRSDEVVRDRDAGEPGVVGVEPAGREMCEGSVDEFGEDLFDDGVGAVLGFGLDEDEWTV